MIERCVIVDCEEPAIARVLPTHGVTEDSALRCRKHLQNELDEGRLREWKVALVNDESIDTGELRADYTDSRTEEQ